MLTVTETAIARFENTLKEHAKESNAVIRMVASEEKGNKLEFVLDDKQDDDQTVENNDGKIVLAVERQLSEQLEGMILDYQDNPEGKGFAIYKVASDS